MKNYYDILEISVDASEEQIKEAYKRLALRYHPDKSNNVADQELFKSINEAKQVLFDNSKRSEYDVIFYNNLLSQNLTPTKNNCQKKKTFSKPGFLLNQSKYGHHLIWLFAALALFIVMVSTYQNATDEMIFSVKESFKENPEILRAEYLNETTLSKTAKALPQSKQTDFELAKGKPSRHFSLNKRVRKKQMAKPLSDQGLQHNEKLLSIQDMEQVLNNLKAEKTKLGSNANCVRILKSKYSNLKNGFDIAVFLANNGFVIAGREVVTENASGIQIDGSDNCIRILLGYLNN